MRAARAYDRPVSDAVGQYVFLDGFCGRIEVEQGQTMVVRIDNISMPHKLAEAREHVQKRYETGDVFPGDGLWGNAEPVRVTAYRWDSDRYVVRIEVERVSNRG